MDVRRFDSQPFVVQEEGKKAKTVAAPVISLAGGEVVRPYKGGNRSLLRRVAHDGIDRELAEKFANLVYSDASSLVELGVLVDSLLGVESEDDDRSRVSTSEVNPCHDSSAI
jgi:hypothetical protein